MKRNDPLVQALNDLQLFLQQSPAPDAAQTLAYLKTTPLPFVACDPALDLAQRFKVSFDWLHLLGQYNLALAIGLCMNQYMTLAIAGLPTPQGSAMQTLQQAFLQSVRQERWLLAVSNFDEPIGVPSHKVSVRCTTQPDGTIVCNGFKPFQSNITSADVLLFSGLLDETESAFFYTLVQDTPGLRLGDPVFGPALADADTRGLYFEGLRLQATQKVPAADTEQALSLHSFTRVLFATTAMAPYLGGAARALDEAGQFLRRVQYQNQPLANLDGYHTDMGRARVQYQVCVDLIERFQSSLQSLCDQDFNGWLARETPKALCLKYHVTRTCEDLVGQMRRIIGTRSLQPNHILASLSQQIVFGPLHPVINAKIERDLGADFLKLS